MVFDLKREHIKFTEILSGENRTLTDIDHDNDIFNNALINAPLSSIPMMFDNKEKWKGVDVVNRLNPIIQKNAVSFDSIVIDGCSQLFSRVSSRLLGSLIQNANKLGLQVYCVFKDIDHLSLDIEMLFNTVVYPKKEPSSLVIVDIQNGTIDEVLSKKIG